MRLRRLPVFFLILCGLPLVVQGVEPSIKKNIQTGMQRIFHDFEITDIQESSIKGLYEVMQGAEIFYVTGDGRYILEGDLYDLKEKQNLTSNQRSVIRTAMLKDLEPDEYIEFGPKHAEHTIYVFTDTDCTYCRRFHKNIAQVNKLGIAVRYLAYPRKGEESPAYLDLESVWCSKDRNIALTNAKLGIKPVKISCDNPISRQYHLGQRMGVRGTPALFTENGRYIGGYLDPDELLQAIKEAD